MPEFNLNLWIENNYTADVRELVSKELEGIITTPGFGDAAPSDYYEKARIFSAVIELPYNITQIIGNGALVVDLDVTIPDGQLGNGVEVLTDEPKLEFNAMKRNWSSSEAFCVSKGGHLASVPSPYHWQRLQDFISNKGLEKDSIWLGGTDEEVEGKWKWTDGSKWSEEHWVYG